MEQIIITIKDNGLLSSEDRIIEISQCLFNNSFQILFMQSLVISTPRGMILKIENKKV